MTETRAFHLGDILSVTTGLFVAPGGFSAVHELLDYMTGDALFTHQLPRACDECAPELLRQHPDLADIEVPATFPEPAEESVPAWLAEQVGRFGAHRDVRPLVPGDHTRIDPITELAMHFPITPVVPVYLPDA